MICRVVGLVAIDAGGAAVLSGITDGQRVAVVSCHGNVVQQSRLVLIEATFGAVRTTSPITRMVGREMPLLSSISYRSDLIERIYVGKGRQDEFTVIGIAVKALCQAEKCLYE